MLKVTGLYLDWFEFILFALLFAYVFGLHSPALF